MLHAPAVPSRAIGGGATISGGVKATATPAAVVFDVPAADEQNAASPTAITSANGVVVVTGLHALPPDADGNRRRVLIAGDDGRLRVCGAGDGRDGQARRACSDDDLP